MNTKLQKKLVKQIYCVNKHPISECQIESYWHLVPIKCLRHAIEKGKTDKLFWMSNIIPVYIKLYRYKSYNYDC
jgi:hypothetical protein